TISRAFRGHHRPTDHRLPLPARHQQMEQDRTPALLSDHSQLARPTPHHLPNHHQPHRQHHNHHRTHRPLRTRPKPLPHKDQSHHPGTKIHTPDPTHVPTKLELHHPTTRRHGRRPRTAHPA